MCEPNDREHVQAVVAAQDIGHGQGHDYEKGSPHLRHDVLRAMIEQRLAALVESRIADTGQCKALEIGGGHGTFTRTFELPVPVDADHIVADLRDGVLTITCPKAGPDVRRITIG